MHHFSIFLRYLIYYLVIILASLIKNIPVTETLYTCVSYKACPCNRITLYLVNKTVIILASLLKHIPVTESLYTW